MKKLENAVEALSDYVAKGKVDNDLLEKIYFAINNHTFNVNKELTELKEKHLEVETELDQRKEIMWNNPIFRQGLIKQVVATLN